MISAFLSLILYHLEQIHSLLQSLVVVVVDAEAALPATQSRFDCDNASEVKKEPMDIV